MASIIKYIKGIVYYSVKCASWLRIFLFLFLNWDMPIDSLAIKVYSFVTIIKFHKIPFYLLDTNGQKMNP